MKLYYFEDCKTEYDVVCHVLNWQGIAFAPCETFVGTTERTHGLSAPVLVDERGITLGVGFNGIMKYLDGRGLLNARKPRI